MINRRRFLETVGGGIAAASIPFKSLAQSLTPPQNVHIVNSPVLAPSDMTYLGVMKCPADVCGFSSGCLTARMLNGQLSFLMTGNRTQGDPVIEFPFVGVGPSLASAPRAPLTTNWGYLYKSPSDGINRKTSWKADGTEKVAGVDVNAWWTYGLQWHNNRLYWTYQPDYGVGGYNDWCIGMTDLRDAPANLVAHGPWRFDNRLDPLAGSHMAGFMTETPDGRVAIGSPMTSGNASSSWGPNLRKITPPNDTTPSGFTGSVIDTTRQVAHDISPYPTGPNGTVPAGVTPHRFRRSADYIYQPDTTGTGPDLDPVANGGQGYWTQNDFDTAAVWIKTSTKEGVLFFGNLATGHVWYGTPDLYNGDPCSDGGRGPQSEGHKHQWWIYDPADCAKVAAGQANSWDIAPVAAFDPSLFGVTLPCKRGVTSAYFDAASNRLFCCSPMQDTENPYSPSPVIHVFQVR